MASAEKPDTRSPALGAWGGASARLFQVSYPRGWHCSADAVTDVVDPHQLFWVSSHPLPRRAADIGLPNLNQLPTDGAVIAAWGEPLATAEHPEDALGLPDTLTLAQFEDGGGDPAANDASVYQQWFGHSGFGLQIFVWIAADADVATTEAGASVNPRHAVASSVAAATSAAWERRFAR